MGSVRPPEEPGVTGGEAPTSVLPTSVFSVRKLYQGAQGCILDSGRKLVSVSLDNVDSPFSGMKDHVE